jgi:AcrR family transcriptional regulator
MEGAVPLDDRADEGSGKAPGGIGTHGAGAAPGTTSAAPGTPGALEPPENGVATGPARRLSAGQRREQLLEVALRQFGERGYRATTMDDIAESAGVTKPLVYQHFRSKRALYFELVDSVTGELLNVIRQATVTALGPRQLVELGFAAYFNQVVSNEPAFQLLFDREGAEDPNVAAALLRVEDALAEAIEPLIAAGLEADHRRDLAYALVGMAEGACRHWMRGREERKGLESKEEVEEQARRLAARMADMAWAGLRSVHSD